MAQKTTGVRHGHMALELGRHMQVMKETGKNEGIELNGELLTLGTAIAELSKLRDRGFVFLPPCPEAWDTSDGNCPSHEGVSPTRS
jgi:hypothetical protein